jgi:hypothetical protein
MGELGYSEMVIDLFTTIGKKDMTYPWTYVTQLFRNGSPSHYGDHKALIAFTTCLLASLVAATFV